MAKVVLIGLGAIGTEILKYALERGHEVVAAVDSDPSKVGRTLAEITGLPSATRVVASLADVQMSNAEVAVFSTRSRFKEIVADVTAAAQGGLDVVTTSEEMAYPEFAAADEAKTLRSVAAEKGVTVVGVGVNPGFVMDLVPAVIASASKNPSSIHVVRSVDVSRRRKQLQVKTGLGHTKAHFEKELEEGKLGHVGLIESAQLIALSLGKPLVGLKHGIFPVIGSEDYVMGVRQFAEGKAGNCQIRLDLEMTMTSADFDVVEVQGDPVLKLRFEKGVFGDSATVAMVVHSMERVHKAPPGLITVLELPLTAS
ncbi:MAG TPA: hypothetical protein VFE91_00495 [Nitrososphaerales archaeon]|nr:hypothetical protein [Nitrososphaerales archaeon]